ncbi:MAG: translocation/assembly module TamB domain-containing protein [candidate division WOR-3 bacterium]
MLQKIKKICLGALALFILVGLSLGLFNLYSKFFVSRKLKELVGEDAQLKGYSFNIFGELRCKELKVGDVFSLKNLRIKYKPLSLLLKKTVNSVTAESVNVSFEKIKGHSKSAPGKPPLTNFELPLFIEEIKINSANFEFERGNFVAIDFLYIAGVNTGSIYRLRAYINKLHFKEYNPYIYADIMIRKNSLKINSLEISDDNFILSGVKGVISPRDSIYLYAEYCKIEDLSLRNLTGTYYIKSKAGPLSCETISYKNYEISRLDGSFKNYAPDSVALDLNNASFRKNTIKIKALFYPKDKRFVIKNAEIVLNEIGFKGTIYSKLDITKDNISGDILSDNLYYAHSSPFRLKGNFTYSRGIFIINIPLLMSSGTSLSGEIRGDGKKISLRVNGQLSLEDLNKDVEGNATVRVDYVLSNKYRNGRISVEALNIKLFALELEKLYVDLKSKDLEDSLNVNGYRLTYGKTKVDMLNVDLHADSLKHFSAEIYGKGGQVSLKSMVNFLLEENGVNISIVDLNGKFNGDSLKIIDPVNINWTFGNRIAILDSALLFINNSPVSLKGNLDINGEAIYASCDFSELAIKDLNKFSGIVSGNLLVNGNLDSPKAWASLHASKINYRFFENGEITSILRIEEDGIYLDSLSVVNHETNLSLEGFIPANLSLKPFRFTTSKDYPFFLKVKLVELPSSLLATLTNGQFVATRATTMGEILISGKDLSNPLLTGFIQIRDFAGIYSPMNLEVTNGEIDLEFTNDEFKIVRGSAQADRGKVNIKGYGKSLFSPSRSININLEASNVSIYPVPNIFANGDGNINIELKDKFINIRGDFFVKDATIFQALRPAASSPRTAPPPQNLNLLINITSEGNTFLVNEFTEVEFKGKLMFQMTEGRYFLDGSVEAIRGYFLYLDRIFEIQHGYINFTASQRMEPEISLVAKTQMDTFNIYLSASGTLQSLRVKLSSEPPLDELNLLYLLTTGRLYGDTVGVTESEFQELKTRALSLATTMLSQSIRRTLKLHEFRLESGPDASSSYLTVGIYVTPRLYFWYSHDLFDITKDLFRVRYKLRRNFGIFAERNQEQRFQIGADFIYEF